MFTKLTLYEISITPSRQFFSLSLQRLKFKVPNQKMVWGVIRLIAVGGVREVKRVRPSYLYSTMQPCLLAAKVILGWIAFSKFV